jgi:hypothetical protein
MKRRRDNTPLFLAVITFMALPALGFAVYKFVINKPPAEPQEETAYVPPVPPPASSPSVPEPQRMKLDVPATVPIAQSTFQPGMIFSGNASGPPTTSSYSSGNAAPSLDKAWLKVNESVGLRKSLVIWLFDSTSSCDGRREEVATALESKYPELASQLAPAAPASASPSATAPAAAGGATVSAKAAVPADAGTDRAKLLTVVARYGTDIEYVTPAPTDDQESILSALRTLKGPGTGTVENTFGAITKAAEKFAEYAGPPHLRSITIIVVTDEVGNDQATRDATLAAVQKVNAPVFVIGQAATFGSVGNQQAGEAKEYFQGPESREVEQPALDGPYGQSMMGQDCGVGPYSLVNLCKESGGEFYASSSMGGVPLPPQYLPRYMSEKAYQEFRKSNKALQALINAAKEPPATPFTGGTSSFTVDDAGTPTVRDIDMAQRPVALLLPAIETQYAKLKEGEADRDKLVEPRHRAAYDLAMGRAMAMVVRARGYNVLLAAFKAGRKGTKPETRVWSLMAGEGIEKDSVLTGMAKKAHEYLERVVKEHPGTQWATAAQQELAQPIGWVWSEG